MIVFTVIGMCILASILGLVMYKLNEIEEETNRINDTLFSRSDYYDSYDEPDAEQYELMDNGEYISLPLLCSHCESTHSDDQDYIVCKDNHSGAQA
jgi:hypothetical protein